MDFNQKHYDELAKRMPEELSQIALSHKAWVQRNPGGLLLELQRHLEALLAGLETCIERDIKPQGELKNYVDGIAEIVEIDDLETAELVLAEYAEAVEDAIARYGQDVRFPISATP